MKTITMKLAILLSLFTCLSYADFKIVNSLAIAEKIPGAKEIMNEGERLNKSRMSELKNLESQMQQIVGEVQKESSDLMAKRSMLSPDVAMKEERKINDKKRRIEELQAQGQRILQDLQGEMQMVQMRLEPFIVEAIQNTIEVAKANPSIDAVWDETTGRIIYKKDSADLNVEVIKLTEKKNEQKTALAKSKPATTSVAPKPTVKSA